MNNKLLTDIESLFKDSSSISKRKEIPSSTNSILVPSLGVAVAVGTTTAMQVKNLDLKLEKILKPTDLVSIN